VFETTLIAMALATTGGSSLADVQAEDIFPETTFFVAQATNLDGVLKAFGQSPMFKSLGDGENFEDMLGPMYEQVGMGLGVAPEKVSLPSEFGLAAYVSFDEDLGIEVPAYLVYLEFDGNESMAKAVFEQRMEQMTVDAGARFEQEEMRGRDLMVVDSGFELPDMDFMEQDMMLPIGADQEFMNDALSTTYILRDGDRLLMCSEPIALDDALAIIDGGKGDSLADDDAYQSLLEMIPEGGRDLKAMILTGNIQPMIAPLFAGPMAGGILPIVQQVFGDIQGYAFWGDMGTDSSVVEGGVSILMDGDRMGLMKLLDTSRPVSEVPGFVPADATNYGRIDFEFKELVPTIREILASLPQGEAQQIEPMFEQFAPLIQSGLETLGPEIHVFTVETDSPFTPTRTTLAIPTSNAESLEQVFSMLAPAAGLMPRDFNGDTIYSDPLDEFSQMAIGIGAGNLVIGQSEGVEAVLRSAGQKDLPKMEGTTAVRAVTRALPAGDLMGWGVIDLGKQVETAQMMMDMMPLLLGQAQIDAAELQGQMLPMMMNIDEESISELFGPGWWYMSSDDRGMIFHAGVMDPAD
jgi:hypothetical protein